MAASRPKSDEALKRAVLGAALERAALGPFGDALLTEAGKDAGASAGEIARLFPQGVLSLIEFYSFATDAEMEKRLAALELAGMPVRTRISTAVLTRLAILKSHKDAARRAAAHLSLPPNLPRAAKLLYRTVDSMWRAAGDLSTDFNFYTKRGILAGVYTATLMHWFNDTSADERDTEVFLAHRIENVLQYEKFKARVQKEAGKGFDRLTEMLRAARR
jgi:ubiquinone biosynthesis protein COQ9